MSLVAQGLAVRLEAALVRLAPLRLLRRQVAVLMDGSMDGSMDRDIEIFDVCLFVCLFVCVKDVVSCFPRDGCES